MAILSQLEISQLILSIMDMILDCSLETLLSKILNMNKLKSLTVI